MKRHAFTLIELLVVIAIIAILAAILFPVFAQAKVAAKRTQTLSNFKQVATAHIIYMGDYDDRVAPLQNEAYSVTNALTTKNYGQLLYPYSKNYELLRDPNDPNANETTLSAGATTQLEKEFNWTQRANTGYNFFYLSPFDANQNFIGVPQTSLARVAQTIMNVESVWDMTGPRSPSGGGNWFVQAPSYANSTTAYWFGAWAFGDESSWFQFGGAYDFVKGNVTATYMDSHAKSMPTPTLWAGSDPVAASVYDWEVYQWGGHPN